MKGKNKDTAETATAVKPDAVPSSSESEPQDTRVPNENHVSETNMGDKTPTPNEDSSSDVDSDELACKEKELADLNSKLEAKQAKKGQLNKSRSAKPAWRR